jgi:hypothetical protein
MTRSKMLMDRALVCATPESLERRLLMAAGDPVTLQFEDPSANLGGAIVAKANAGYTGSGYVDYIDNNGLVGIPINGVPATGMYEITFRYANGSSSARAMNVDSSVRPINPRLAFPPTGSWSKWGTVKVQAQLKAGDNDISLAALGQNGPNLDSLTYRALPSPLPEGITVQAEDAFHPLGGSHVAADNLGYTGEGYLDFDADSGAVAVLEFPGPAADGTYSVDFRYANGSKNTRTLGVSRSSGGSQVLVDFPPTGSWTTWRTVSIQLQMDTNNDSFGLVTTGSNGPNLDAVTIRPAASTPFSRTIQVEEATNGPVTNAHVARSNPGYTGSGYLDFDGPGAFNVSIDPPPAAGRYALEVRYANGTGASMPLSLKLSESGRVIPRLELAQTGSWSTWKTVSVEVPLTTSGESLAIGSPGERGPNIDSIRVVRVS